MTPPAGEARTAAPDARHDNGTSDEVFGLVCGACLNDAPHHAVRARPVERDRQLVDEQLVGGQHEC